MSKKVLKRFCNIPLYLEQRDKDLHYAVQSMCATGLLVPKGKVTGVTFLYPTDAKYRQEIIDLAFSKDQEKALHMFQALIISIPIGSLDSFSHYKDDLSNKLGQKVEVLKVSSNEVKLKHGTVTIASDFSASKDRDNIFVYNLDGRVPIDGPQSAMTYVGKKIDGGTVKRGTASDRIYHEDVKNQINAYLGGESKDFLAERVVSAMLWYSKKYPDLYRERFYCFTGIPAVDYYTFLRFPYATKLPMLDEWLSETGGIYISKSGNVYDDYYALYDMHASKSKDDPHAALREQVRAKLIETGGAKLATISGLRDAYTTAYGADAYNRMWVDEIRFMSFTEYACVLDAYTTLERARQFKDFEFALKVLYAPDNKVSYLRVFGDCDFNTTSPVVHICSTVSFIRSDALLWVPQTTADAASSRLPDYTVAGKNGVELTPYAWFKAVIDKMTKSKSEASITSKRVIPEMP